MDGFTTFAIHDSLGLTRWLWWFNSTQFIFSGRSKETRFLIRNYIRIEVNDSTLDSFRAMANQEPIKLNSLMSFNTKCCKYTLLHICLNSSPPKLGKSVAKQSVIWCCWHWRAALIFDDMTQSQSFSRVIVFPLSLGRQFQWISIISKQRSKLSYFLY